MSDVPAGYGKSEVLRGVSLEVREGEVVTIVGANGAGKTTTVLLVEQNVFHTLKLADCGYVLENGSVALTGTGAELLRNPHVRRAYLGH